MKTFNEYKQDAEIAIDGLMSEVFYMNEICGTKEEVQEVLRIYKYLREYIEDNEFDLEHELEYMEEQ